MKIFGIRLIKESTYTSELERIEARGIAKGERWAKVDKQKEYIKKFKEANIIITKVELMNNPSYSISYSHFYGEIHTIPTKYKISFHTLGGAVATDITLEFDDPDVSISDLKRAIQAKICGGGCFEN